MSGTLPTIPASTFDAADLHAAAWGYGQTLVGALHEDSAALQAARREQPLPPRRWRLAACAEDRHLVDAIAADRDRLEQINDRLRGEIASLRTELAEARAKAAA